MELRDYQKECVDTVNALPDGARTVVCLATGLGKTVTASRFAFKGRMLWLSHRDELVRQPERYFEDIGLSYGIEKADERSDGEDVVSASIQSICRDERLKKFSPNEFDVVICDEAQHAAAPTYRKVLSYFRPRKLIGLTATPKRGDGVRLTDVFDDICFVRDLKWGIENGYLSRIRCLHVSADYDMDKAVFTLGDFTAGSLGKEMEDSNDDAIVAKAYAEHAFPENRQTLIYCPTIRNCEKVASAVRNALPEKERDSIAVLSDGTAPDKRREILDKYRKREIRCIVNCMILTEGADLPETSCIINNRPTANSSLYQQIIGRGTRLAEGKEYCLIIDVVGKNYEKKDLTTAPTLFGIDPEMLPKEAREKMEESDLLEFAEAVKEEQAKTKEKIALRQYLVDLFTQERIAAIEEGAEGGYRKIAEIYERRIGDDGGTKAGFGDVLARTTPNEERRYRIDATYEGRLYVSEPDMMGNSVLEAEIPDVKFNGRPISFLSVPMPFEKAVETATDILKYLIPENFSMKWSKKTREALSGIPATARQKGKVKFEFFEYGVRDDCDGMTMMQASDLIDLASEIKELKETSKAYAVAKREAEERKEDRQTERKPRKNKPKKTKEEKKAEARLEKKRNAWENFEKSFRPVANRKKSEEKKMIKEEEKSAGKIKSFSLPVDFTYYSKDKPVSERQTSFIESLLKDAERKGYVMDRKPNPNSLGVDSWQASVVISYLLHLKKNGPVLKSHKAEFKFEDFLEQVRSIERSEDGTEIRCSYRILSDSETN